METPGFLKPLKEDLNLYYLASLTHMEFATQCQNTGLFLNFGLELLFRGFVRIHFGSPDIQQGRLPDLAEIVGSTVGVANCSLLALYSEIWRNLS